MKKIVSMLLALSMMFTMSISAFAAISHSAEAKAVLSIVNEERRAAGVGALTWESSLVSYATTRAREASELWSHTRPNGKSSLDYEGANGENLAYGTDFTAEDVMIGWMDSPDHRENILDPDFTSIAVACVEIGDYYYWCQIFHSNKKVKADGTVVEAADSLAVSSKTVIAALDKANTSAAKTVSVTVKDKSAISPAAIKEIAAWGTSKGKTASLVANTSFTDSTKIQGQFTFNPASFSKQAKDLKLGVYVEEDQVSSVRAKMDKWYSNTTAIIKLEQTGALAGTVKIAAKADLSKLDTKNLVFYVYDKASNKVTQIKNPDYSIDKNNFVHFVTNMAGDIIITNKALMKK